VPEELAKEDILRVRALEALREIGELFIAFGPLEVLLSRTIREDLLKAAAFVFVGVAFLAYAILIERRRSR
jgi:hypothetical protein